MSIIENEQLIDIIKSKTEIDEKDVEVICHLFMQTLYDILKEGQSISFGDNYPLMKTKIRVRHLNEGSPRTPGNDYIYTSIRIPLQTKAGKSIDKTISSCKEKRI